MANLVAYPYAYAFYRLRLVIQVVNKLRGFRRFFEIESRGFRFLLGEEYRS